MPARYQLRNPYMEEQSMSVGVGASSRSGATVCQSLLSPYALAPGPENTPQSDAEEKRPAIVNCTNGQPQPTSDWLFALARSRLSRITQPNHFTCSTPTRSLIKRNDGRLLPKPPQSCSSGDYQKLSRQLFPQHGIGNRRSAFLKPRWPKRHPQPSKRITPAHQARSSLAPSDEGEPLGMAPATWVPRYPKDWNPEEDWLRETLDEELRGNTKQKNSQNDELRRPPKQVKNSSGSEAQVQTSMPQWPHNQSAILRGRFCSLSRNSFLSTRSQHVSRGHLDAVTDDYHKSNGQGVLPNRARRSGWNPSAAPLKTGEDGQRIPRIYHRTLTNERRGSSQSSPIIVDEDEKEQHTSTKGSLSFGMPADETTRKFKKELPAPNSCNDNQTIILNNRTTEAPIYVDSDSDQEAALKPSRIPGQSTGLLRPPNSQGTAKPRTSSTTIQSGSAADFATLPRTPIGSKSIQLVDDSSSPGESLEHVLHSKQFEASLPDKHRLLTTVVEVGNSEGPLQRTQISAPRSLHRPPAKVLLENIAPSTRRHTHSNQPLPRGRSQASTDIRQDGEGETQPQSHDRLVEDLSQVQNRTPIGIGERMLMGLVDKSLTLPRKEYKPMLNQIQTPPAQHYDVEAALKQSYTGERTSLPLHTPTSIVTSKSGEENIPGKEADATEKPTTRIATGEVNTAGLPQRSPHAVDVPTSSNDVSAQDMESPEEGDSEDSDLDEHIRKDMAKLNKINEELAAAKMRQAQKLAEESNPASGGSGSDMPAEPQNKELSWAEKRLADSQRRIESFFQKKVLPDTRPISRASDSSSQQASGAGIASVGLEEAVSLMNQRGAKKKPHSSLEQVKGLARKDSEKLHASLASGAVATAGNNGERRENTRLDHHPSFPAVKKNANGVIEAGKVTDNDWLLCSLRGHGYTWNDIEAQWRELTGSSRSSKWLRCRFARMKATYPEVFKDIESATCGVRSTAPDVPEPPKARARRQPATSHVTSNDEMIDSEVRADKAGKTISPDLAKYILASLGNEFSEVDSEAEEEEEIDRSSPPREDDSIHFAYQVTRRTTRYGEEVDEAKWLVCGPTYSTMAEANAAATEEIKADRQDAVWPLSKWSGECSNATGGMAQYRGENEDGDIVEVVVDRFARTWQEGIMPESKESWISRRVFDVVETTTTSEEHESWKEDEVEEVELEAEPQPSDGEKTAVSTMPGSDAHNFPKASGFDNATMQDVDGDDAFDDLFEEDPQDTLKRKHDSAFENAPRQPTKTRIRTITKTKVIERHTHTKTKAIGGVFSVRDRANRLAGRTYLKAKRHLNPDPKMRRQSMKAFEAQQREERDMDAELNQMEDEDVGFERRVEADLSGEGAGAGGDGTTSVEVKVVERILENPRNF